MQVSCYFINQEAQPISLSKVVCEDRLLWINLNIPVCVGLACLPSYMDYVVVSIASIC